MVTALRQSSRDKTKANQMKILSKPSQDYKIWFEIAGTIKNSELGRFENVLARKYISKTAGKEPIFAVHTEWSAWMETDELTFNAFVLKALSGTPVARLIQAVKTHIKDPSFFNWESVEYHAEKLPVA